jgi:hypothetical protein
MKYRIYSQHDLKAQKARPQPGDFIVTHTGGFINWLIRWATFSRWNHAALVVDAEGTIIEALTRGLRKNNMSKYSAQELYLVQVDLSDEDRREVVAYGKAILKRHPAYGFMAIASIALKILTRSRLVFKLDGTLICSEFVANALARGGVIWYKDTSLITPADQYRRFVKHKK